MKKKELDKYNPFCTCSACEQRRMKREEGMGSNTTKLLDSLECGQFVLVKFEDQDEWALVVNSDSKRRRVEVYVLGGTRSNTVGYGDIRMACKTKVHIPPRNNKECKSCENRFECFTE